MSSKPGSIAFDFDGVLCNGLKEYFQTAWRVYCEYWTVSSPVEPEGLAERFYTLRPVVEVGWEMPVVLRAIIQGFSDADILTSWPEIRQQLVKSEDLSKETIGQWVDGTRDQWIQTDLEGWLALHEFYPGTLETLQNLQHENIPFVIITTKESRFVRALLQRAQLDLASDKIFGKDCQRPKPETLKRLKPNLPGPIWFIEDRIAALQAVRAESSLQDVGLFLAEWGYNVALDHQNAKKTDGITCLSLETFNLGVESWLQANA